MKKIDLMLKLLFAVVFANGASAQLVGPYPGGADCESAVPIEIGNGYAASDDCLNEWYSFVAPCDGELTISDNVRNNGKRIYSGACGSLTLEGSVTFSGDLSVDMTSGETVYFESLNDNWCGGYSFNVEFENPACPQPTSLASFVPDYETANIAWFAGGGESNWNVVYGPAGFDPATGGTVVPVSGSPSTTLTGLEELTCYDFYVEAVCGGGEVSCFLSGPETFCTPAICPAPLSPTEDDITNTTTTLNWSAGDSETMWDVSWGPEGFVLGDADETFVDDTPFPTEALSDLTPDMCYDWYVRAVCEVDLGDGPETVNSIWVGPSEWCTTPNCIDPSDGVMIAEDGLSATLSWTVNNDPAEEEWNIQYGPAGFTLGTGITVTNIPTNPYTLTDLMPDTDYDFYVQAVCGAGGDSLSGYAGPFGFSTSTFCEEPISLFGSGTSGDEATLSWSAGGAETSWDVSWGPAPLDDPMDGTMEDADVFPSLNLTGLTPGEQYCFYVRANCGDDEAESSAWAGPFCWTQPADCATPFLLNMINITNTAAFVDFTAPGGETYDIEWGAPCFEPGVGEEFGSVEGTEDSPYYITGLEESTPYWVYVRSTCGVDSISSWSEPLLFGTDISNDNPCDAEELVLDGPALLRHNFEATTLTGETALAPPTVGDCFGTDGWCSGDGVDNTVWFKFVAPASGQATVSTFDESTCMTNSYTEIAVYETGDCGIFANYELVAANSSAEGVAEPPYGSEITACGLTPGATYYVMVNPIGFIQPDVHFSIQLSSVEEVSAGLGLSPTICAGSEYDLFNSIAGYSDGGTWYNPTVAPGNELPNMVDFPDVESTFNFYYVVNNGCDADTVMTAITTENGINAGGDGYYTACNTYDIILSDHLVGEYDGGGIWQYTGEDPDVALAGGLFTVYGMTPGVYEFLYTVTNEYCPTDSAYVTVTVTGCMSTGEEELNNLVVYPNPVVDILTVQNVNVEGDALVEVLDIEGRVVISNAITNASGNITINMSAIESGVYFVKVTADNSVQKVRVVKQ